jgi:hypothetical protein
MLLNIAITSGFCHVYRRLKSNLYRADGAFWQGNRVDRKQRSPAARGSRARRQAWHPRCRGADVSYEVELLEPKLDFV